MAYSELTIIFDEDLILNNQIGFSFSTPLSDLNGDPLKLVTERWVNNRTGIRQTIIGVPTDIPGERSAINFEAMFELDYNTSNLFNVIRSENVVIIQANNADYDFSQEFSIDDYTDNPVVLNTKVRFIINNFSGSVYRISNVSFSQSTINPVCTHYKVLIQTSVITDSINGSYTIASGNTDNPIEFEAQRGLGFLINLITNEATVPINNRIIQSVYSQNQVPSVLSKSLFSLKINNAPNGATLIVNSNNIYLLDLEYSLDNTNWQSENTFSGLLTGNFTLYIRDNLGCNITIDFNINDDNVYIPVSYYSKTNSIIMVERDESENKTEENTLSNESFAINPKLAHPEYHLFKNTHVIPCQLLTNYSNISAKIVKENGSEDDLFVNKFTYNLGRKDSRDAVKFNAGLGKTGIYFFTGKLYDYDTDTYINKDYSLLGGLPEWAKIGNYVSIDNAWFKIENKYHDDDLGAEVILIDSEYVGNPTNIITKCIFNRQKYDVFEWNINMNVYNNQTIRVKTIETDSKFPTKTRISEKIMIKESFEDLVEIVSYNTKNTDIFYASGIKHYALLHTASISGDHEDPSEINKGDDSSALVDSKLYESLEFDFDLLSLGGYRQLTRMLSNNMVFISSQQFIKNGNLEKEGPLGDSNLYKLKAKMLYAQGGLNSNESENELITENENLDVPNLKITDSGKYVTYQ